MKQPKVLRSYQEEAIDFIVDNPSAGLFIDMGLGKTAIILHALLEAPRPVLLVGPIRVIETVWEKEAQEWTATRKLRFSLVRGKPKDRLEKLRTPADIYMTNPELLGEVLDNKTFKTLVIDESTTFKNPSSQRFLNIKRHLPKFEKRIIATGTPTPNSLFDLWSQVYILDGGQALGKFHSRFKQSYFEPIDYFGYKFAPRQGAREYILKKIAPLIFRVPAKGALPARTVITNVVNVPLPEAVRVRYQTMEQVALARVSSDVTITAATAASVIMKLRQITSGFLYDENGDSHHLHGAKLDALSTIVEETGSPLIIVYNFVQELDMLKAKFPQGVLFTPSIDKDWNAGKIPLMFLNPKSGGHGLNLQYGGHTMAFMSGSYSLEDMQQVLGRIDRQGQEFPVVVHYLVVPNTVDELIMSILSQKAEQQSDVLRLIKEYADART